MKDLLIKILVLLSVINSKLAAQAYFPDVVDSSKYSLSIGGNYYYGSDCIYNPMLKNFIYGLDLYSKDKKNWLAEVLPKARVGAEFEYNVRFETHWLDSLPLYGWFVNVGHRGTFNALIPEDAIKLAFFGNGIFENKTARWDGLNIGLINYQYFKAGITRKLNNTGNQMLGLSLNFYKGQDMLDLGVEQGELFTAYYGEYLDLKLDYEAWLCDTAPKNLLTVNGLGGGLDLFYRDRTRWGYWELKAADIGFMRWNSNTFHTQKDTAIFFDGVRINDLLHIDSTAFDGLPNDSLLDELGLHKREALLKTMPARFEFNSRFRISDNYFGEIMAYYRLNSNQLPVIAAKAGYKILSSELKLLTSWGGWTGLNFGAEMILRTINHRHEFALGTYSLKGLLVFEKAMSNQLFLSYKIKF